MGFEPVETARALPLMSSHTLVFMNTTPVIPFVLAQRTVQNEEAEGYPDVAGLTASIRAVAPHTVAFDATSCAREAGSTKALNTVMLGCLLAADALPCPADDFWMSASQQLPPALRETNAAAFRAGARNRTPHASEGLTVSDAPSPTGAQAPDWRQGFGRGGGVA